MNKAAWILVVPCYNEAPRFQADQFRLFLSHRDDTALIFVNDGSTDHTLAVLKQLQAELPARIEILDLSRNSGKAEAVRAGLLRALEFPGVSCAGFWDADLATPLNAVDDLLGVLTTHPEVQMVFGSRVKLLGRNVERRPLRHYLGRVFATFASLALRLAIYDTQCGAKLFRATPDLAAVLRDPFCSRWIFDVEIIARFRRLYSDKVPQRDLSNAIYEFPLHCWRDIPGSKVRPRDFLKAIRDLLVIHRRYLRNL